VRDRSRRRRGHRARRQRHRLQPLAAWGVRGSSPRWARAHHRGPVLAHVDTPSPARAGWN